MNYDTMSAHELVGYLVYAPDNLNIHVTCMHDYGKDHDIIESALRKAVIREASVGVVKLSHNGVVSDYDLVPKEVAAISWYGLLATPEELAYMKREIELHEDYELNVGKTPEIK